ncbi:MAG: adenylate cyclase, partial [Ignavibacteriaceae bacterium]
LVIGAVAGILVVFAVIGFDRLKIDDPVGALAVHLVNGIFGTITLGLFAEDKFMPGTTGNGLFFGGGFTLLLHQIIGAAAVGAFIFIVSYIVWSIIKAAMGIRVSEREEIEGLDMGEHGLEAYPDFEKAVPF